MTLQPIRNQQTSRCYIRETKSKDFNNMTKKLNTSSMAFVYELSVPVVQIVHQEKPRTIDTSF